MAARMPRKVPAPRITRTPSVRVTTLRRATTPGPYPERSATLGRSVVGAVDDRAEKQSDDQADDRQDQPDLAEALALAHRDGSADDAGRAGKDRQEHEGQRAE